MKKFLLSLVSVLIIHLPLHSQLTGLWKTVDDTDGVEKSIIEIFESDGKLHGRVDRLLAGADKTHCTACRGDLKDKPITGMLIMWDLTLTDEGGTNGKILDPASGKTYSCNIELENPDTLKLRGYLGMPAFGRTQYWHKVR